MIGGYRTPEQRKASALKGIETRRKNIAQRSAAHDLSIHALYDISNEISKKKEELEALEAAIPLCHAAISATSKRLLLEDEIVAESKQWLSRCGVYFLIKDKKVVYIGQSIDIFSRIPQHKDKEFDRFLFIECDKSMLDKLESLYIHLIRPPLNGNQSDGAKLAPLSLADLLGRELN